MPSTSYETADQTMQNFYPPYSDQGQQAGCLQDFHGREAEQAAAPQMETLMPGAKRQGRGKRNPSAASLAQKKYMERQKVKFWASFLFGSPSTSLY